MSGDQRSDDACAPREFSLWEALYELVPAPAAQSDALTLLQLYGAPADAPSRPHVSSDARRLPAQETSDATRARALLALLRRGDLVARGFKPGSSAPEAISAEWWQNPEWCFAEGWVKANELKFTGVLVSRPKTSPQKAARSSSKNDEQKRERAEGWMRKHVTQPGQWKRESAINQCMNDMGVPYRTAETAWNSLDSSLRGSRGKHK